MIFYYFAFSLHSRSFQRGFCVSQCRKQALRKISKHYDPLIVMPFFLSTSMLRSLREALCDLFYIVKSSTNIVASFSSLARSGNSTGIIFAEMSEKIERGLNLKLVLQQTFLDLDPILASILIAHQQNWKKSLSLSVEYLDQRIAISSKIFSSMMYPLFVLFILVIVSWFYFLFLLPNISIFFFSILISITFIAILGNMCFSNNFFFNKEYSYVSFFYTLHYLTEAGFLIQDAIHIASESSNLSELRSVKDNISRGSSFSDSLCFLPVTVTSMLCNSHTTKSLSSSCLRVGQYYLNRIKQKSQILDSLLAPTLICFVGIFITSFAYTVTSYDPSLLQ